MKELEAALNDGRADLAAFVKDVPMELPDGLDLCCLTARETLQCIGASHPDESLD